MLAAVVVAACSGSGGGGPGPVGPLEFDVRVTIPPNEGVQVGRPFAIRVDFFVPGTTEPFAVPTSESVSVSIASGDGSLSGTLQLSGDGTATLVFDRLAIDRTGDVQLEVRVSSPEVPAVVTDPFSVGQALDFEFVDPRTVAYAGVPYDVRLRVVEAGTGVALVPDYPVEATLQSDNGEIRIAAVDASGEVAFQGLVESAGVTTTGWTVSAFGFPTVALAAVPVEVLTVAGLSITGSDLVGGDFQVTGTIVGSTSGLPAVDVPDLTVEISSAGGALTGTTNGTSNGSAFSIGPMQLVAAGDFTLEVDGPHFAVPVGIVTRASYALVGTTAGPTTALPNEPLGPFPVQLVDAFGIGFAGAAD
ncbi:MAG: hypothetical protein KDB80_13865, partial [Planctomycetes bacterium]|nr:hypothetical protein [Planctomycetota bacterium]